MDKKIIYLDDSFNDVALKQKARKELCKCLYSFIAELLNQEDFKTSDCSIWKSLRKVLAPIKIPKSRTLKTVVKECKELCRGETQTLDMSKKSFILLGDDKGIIAEHSLDQSRNRKALTIEIKESYLVLTLVASSSILLRKTKKKPSKIYSQLLIALTEHCSEKNRSKFIGDIADKNASTKTGPKWTKEVVVEQGEIRKLKHTKGSNWHLWAFESESLPQLIALNVSQKNEVRLFHLETSIGYKKTLRKIIRQNNPCTLSVQNSVRKATYGSVPFSIGITLAYKRSNNAKSMKA